uniref:Uncharacterized protein n=1 Tax=Heterorhabditis bacteriophora TaxID=37862 RepID=A0A1I7XJL3_HETBA
MQNDASPVIMTIVAILEESYTVFLIRVYFVVTVMFYPTQKINETAAYGRMMSYMRFLVNE